MDAHTNLNGKRQLRARLSTLSVISVSWKILNLIQPLTYCHWWRTQTEACTMDRWRMAREDGSLSLIFAVRCRIAKGERAQELVWRMKMVPRSFWASLTKGWNTRVKLLHWCISKFWCFCYSLVWSLNPMIMLNKPLMLLRLTSYIVAGSRSTILFRHVGTQAVEIISGLYRWHG